MICYSADHAPGWVVATTWQLTIIASIFVLVFFGRCFPKKTWIFSFVVFSGVLAVNLSHLATVDLKALLLGGVPVLVAAFCYPSGNQLVWEAQNGNRRLQSLGTCSGIPPISSCNPNCSCRRTLGAAGWRSR